MDKNKKEAQRKRKRNSKILISMCHWRLHMFVVLVPFSLFGGDADLQLL